MLCLMKPLAVQVRACMCLHEAHVLACWAFRSDPAGTTTRSLHGCCWHPLRHASFGTPSLQPPPAQRTLCASPALLSQVRAPLALVIHATALLPDAHMYAVLVYGCTAQGWACSLLRSLLQNSFALCLHGLLDMRARMVFLRQHGRGTTRKQPQQQYLAVQSNDREAVPQGAAVQQQGRGEHAGHGKEKQL